MSREIRAVLVCLVIIILAISNPSKSEYVSWLKSRLMEDLESDNPIVMTLTSIVGGPLIETSTSTRNYAVFSVFETKVGSESIRILGILRNFIPLHVSIDFLTKQPSE